MSDADYYAFESLLILLQQLDQRLERAIKTAQIAYETDAEQNPYRGMQIDQAEVKRLLDYSPAAPVLSDQANSIPDFSFSAFPESSCLRWLHQTFGLSDFDLGILAIALAPELDRRYERLYAYLQDDVRCKRPTVDLCLNLLCCSSVEKLTRRSHFTAQSPLIRQGLLYLIPDPSQPDSPLLAQAIKLDPQVIHLLLQIKELDDRLTVCCEWVTPKIRFQDLPFPPAIAQALPVLLQDSWTDEQPLRLYFHGSDHTGKRRVAEAIAHFLKVPLILVNVVQLVRLKAEFVPTLNVMLREAVLQNALLYFEGIEALQTSDQEAHYQSFVHLLAYHAKITIFAGERASLTSITHRVNSGGVLSIAFPMPDFEQRQWYWSQSLQDANISLDAADITVLSDRLKLTADQIATAVATAQHQHIWRTVAIDKAASPSPISSPQTLSQRLSVSDLFAAALQISSQNLDGLCRQIQPRYCWDDLVLPTAQKSLLQEICNQIKYQNLVQTEWGFDRWQSSDRGLSVMFAGPPGTGKTMAAEVIAQELKLDLYKIDLSQIVSKYIGETEKNLNQIFTAATNANAILLFDEADALFGKRTEIKDAHDRYANLEVSYLLQKMEEYEGLAILTTNLRSNMDEAFVRRLRFIIEFPFPTEQQRQQIWRRAFPDLAPCNPSVDFAFLADSFELSGAAIRNIALAAAFLAATEHQPIEMNHITQAIRREYQKMGKILTLPSKATDS